MSLRVRNNVILEDIQEGKVFNLQRTNTVTSTSSTTTEASDVTTIFDDGALFTGYQYELEKNMLAIALKADNNITHDEGNDGDQSDSCDSTNNICRTASTRSTSTEAYNLPPRRGSRASAKLESELRKARHLQRMTANLPTLILKIDLDRYETDLSTV